MDEPSLTEKKREDEIAALIHAFRYFNQAATSLSSAYRTLQSCLGELTQELQARDQQLYQRFLELDRLNRFFVSLVDSLRDGVIAVNNEGVITVFNRAAERMLGLSAETVMGKPYREVFANIGESTPAYPRGALRTLMEGPEIRGEEWWVESTNKQLSSSTVWVVDSLGERIGVVEVLVDISERRFWEAQLQQQKNLMEMGEMAGEVAHEFRNPLTVIGGYALLLQRDLGGTEPYASWLERILSCTNSLHKIIDNLLYLSRPVDIRFEALSLHELLTDVVNRLMEEAQQEGIKVKFELNLPEEKIPVYADAESLKMIFTNLGKNAFQAVSGKEDGRVSIGLIWNMLNNRFEVGVRDNGVGITEEHLNKIFNIFFTTRHGGTGLGLALVKKAVDLHHGEIRVQSAVGEGSIFTVSLPIRPLEV